MEQFQKILVAVNTKSENHQALPRAVRLAKTTGARITAIDVVKPPPRWHPQFDPPPWILPSALAQEKERRLRKIVAPLRAGGIQAGTAVFHGDASTEIIREALRNGHDLVMKTAESERGWAGVFGSTDMRLLRQCPRPLWLVKPDRLVKHERVLAAVDPSASEEAGHQVNRKVMELAIMLARSEGAQVHVVHAWRPFGENILKGYAGVPAGARKDYFAETRAATQEMYNQFLVPYQKDLSPGRVHFVKGDPERVIPNLCRTKKISLVVMGTVARTGVAGLLIGNTAERVVSRLGCSLLAVKPDGFVSPVKLEE
jgi:nucleotide-binding universal stress UspA family protein